MTRFKKRNTDLSQLPLGILSHERVIREQLAALAASRLSLAEQMRWVEERELTPFVTGSRLRGEFRLHLGISDDLDRLTISKIDGEHRTTPLVEVPGPNLLFSAFDVARFARGHVERELAAQLYTLGRRITTYRGVTTIWDQAVDRRVWCTNIDTVYFLHALHADGVFARTDVRSAMEIGVGGGHISKAVVAGLPSLREHTATDINAYALFCAQRNLQPVLRPDTELNLYLGKGLRPIEATVDLLLVNPPYIPHRQKPDAVDPYRGTGLIKEVVEIGLSRLDPANPRAAIYLGMSSLAQRDLAEYLAANPQVEATTIGTPREVPLKILAINEDRDWLDFLRAEHGLIVSEERAHATGFPMWHAISVVKLQGRKNARIVGPSMPIPDSTAGSTARKSRSKRAT
jgi:hypothetical protein